MAEVYSDRNDLGWIALQRAIRTHHIVGFGQPVKPAEDGRGAHSRAEAWIDLIMLACHKTTVWMNKGRKVELQTGELPGAYSYLAKRWNWTVKTVRNFLEKLLKEGMMGKPEHDSHVSEKGKQSSNQVQVLSVCNYSTYQVAREILKVEEGQAKGKQGASEGHESNKLTIRQEKEDSIVHLTANDTPPSVWIAPDGLPKVINGKRAVLEKMLGGRADLVLDDVLAKVAPQVAESMPDDLWADLTAAVAMVAAAAPKRKRKAAAPLEPAEYPKGFDEFWKIYPRRQAKGEAVKSWGKLTIEQRRRAYVALKQQLPALDARASDPKGNFCPMPSTWLNQGRFDDDPAPEFRREPAYVLQSDRHLEGVL